MATIVGGIAASHTPSIAFAFDTQKADDPVWAPIFEGFAPVRAWLKEKAPDVLFFVYNDHVTSFFFDHYSNFTLGFADTFAVADEGGGPRPLPAIKGHPALAKHIANGLVADEFDLSFFQSKGLDHGVFSPLSIMLPHEHEWPVALVPLQVGVLQFPIPTARRCFALGRSLRKAIQSFPGGSQGRDRRLRRALPSGQRRARRLQQHRLGHGVSGAPRKGSREADRIVHCGLCEARRHRGRGSHHVAGHARRADAESAQGASVVLPSVDDRDCDSDLRGSSEDDEGESPEAYLARARREYEGVSKIEGSYPFTFERSSRAYRLNKYLHGIIQPELRGRFFYDREGSYVRGELDEEEKDMLRRLDWRALIRYGVIFFILEKLGAAVGVPNQKIYAAMRGESLEDFQKTRKTRCCTPWPALISPRADRSPPSSAR